MADDDTRLDSGAVGTTEQPPPEPEASTAGPGHPAQDAAPVPDSIAQPGQALPQNTTIAPATTTTKLPLGTGPGLEARMPLTEDDATIAHDSAAVAEGNDAAERHHQAPQAGQGNTAATAPHDAAQETSSIGQAAQNPDIVPLLPAETAAIQSSGVSEMPVGGETQAQADLTPMPDPASALHHHPAPEPATDAAPPPAAASAGELPVPHFVAPSSYLRPKTSQRRGHPPTAAMASHEHRPPPGPYDKEQLQGLKAIRDFLKVRTSYDVLPLSFRLIVLDTNLLIKKSLNILIQNSIVSAPLWDSQGSKFAGILTSTDYLNVIRYYCTFPDEMHELDQFRLSSLRAIEKAIGAIPIETVSVHPSRPLYEACERMLKTRARRIPLVDTDDETGQEMVVSVITQYRILKFIAVNNEHNTVMLKKSVREIGLGTYDGLVTANMMTSILDAVGLMVDQNISCIPIVDKNNIVLNVFEAVDIIPCIKGGAYEELDGTVGDALCKRSDDSPGIYTCSQDDRLESIFDTIRKSRVHRLIVVDDDNRLKGVISLSDILKYVLLYGEDDHSMWR